MVWMPTIRKDLPVALSIAGSDTVTGAGIQADIKTFVSHGVYPVTVITAITAQNTMGIQEVYPLPSKIVERQIESVFSDVEVRSVKIGVIYTKEIAKTIHDKIKQMDIPKVLDPIIKSQTGQMLVESQETLEAIKEKLMPIIDVLTPNKDEAEILSGIKISKFKDAEEAAKTLSSMGPETVVIKGLFKNSGKSIDLVYHLGKIYKLEMDLIENITIHGAGCSFSSAITANLAKGLGILESIKLAKKFVWDAIKHSIEVGKGIKIVNQMAEIYKDTEKEKVRQELWKAYQELRKIKSITSFIPETRTNFVYSLPEPKDINDVAGFPGRLIIVDEELIAYHRPEFGASNHMARFVLEANKMDKNIRSAINLKYSDQLIKNAVSIGLDVVEVNRDKEPLDIKKIEGESIQWIVREAFAIKGYMPDIIYDKGTIGKESMIRILGKEPKEIVEKIKKILRIDQLQKSIGK